jgi:hypothetical protein
MKNLTLNDHTQVHLSKHLAITEHLLAKVASITSGKEQDAEIYLMPDLGLPLNIHRMHGGFYTGALYSWTCSVPIVPVDATVNSCGVSVFRVSRDIETEHEFLQIIKNAIRRTTESSYKWNFASGNHFIIYGEVQGSDQIPNGRYIVLHSSASEFKNQYNGLYPTDNNWYSDDIKVYEMPNTNRYIRYLDGKVAEKFIDVAKMLDGFNILRHRFFAGLLIDTKHIEDEIINIQHYGMPTNNSIAIGCQWFSQPFTLYLLLTAPDKPLYFIKTLPNVKNFVTLEEKSFWLSPHGLGVRSSQEPKIKYLKNSLSINNQTYKLSEKLILGNAVEVRTFDNADHIPKLIHQVLQQCPGNVVGSLKPIFSYDYRSIVS